MPSSSSSPGVMVMLEEDAKRRSVPEVTQTKLGFSEESVSDS